MRTAKKWFLSDGSIGLLLMLLMLFAFYFEWKPLEVMEYKIYDLGLYAREKPVSSPVVIVSIDDQSIASLGRWPWPRYYIAQAIDLLQSYKAKIIGVDIIYSENDVNQGLLEVRDLINKISENPAMLKNRQVEEIYTSLMDAEKRLDNDAILAMSIAGSKRVVLPLFFALGTTMGGSATDMPDYSMRNSLEFEESINSINAVEMIPPIPDFASRALALGHINIIADRDGAVRSEPLLINFENRIYPSFALQIALRYLNYDLKDLRYDDGLNIKRIHIPTFESNKMLISYSRDFPVYSFLDLLSEKIPPQEINNKIVIIGQSATGLGTVQVTPIHPQIPSWGIIANVISNILNKNHIVRPNWAFYVELGMILFFGLFLALVIPRLRAGISAFLSLIFLLAWSGTAIYFLIVYGYWIKILYPGLLLIVGYTILVSKKYLLTEKTKEHMEADSIETNKMLGLSFQGQGMLDIAFDKFRKCPVEDESIKELLYNLGLDFERKRMFNKAVAVYEHILKVGKFKDIHERIQKLKIAGETAIFGLGGAKKDTTVLVENAQTKPTLGRYEVLKELGRGAMGTVYLGKDPKINREVAIKTLRYGELDEEHLPEIKKRFFREAEAAGKLSHPNIVTIYDVGEDYDIAYMAMELLEGMDLTKYCAKEHLLPVNEVLRVITSVASALEYAHSSSVVHRDIKPANIMFLKNGDIKVTDFGIARVMTTSKTQTGVILGTPSYMSPEQIAGQKVDGRSDLFSLGVVFYELLTGEKPFKGDSMATLMYNITSAAPVPVKEFVPHIPDPLVSVINKLLDKNREMRYQSGKDIVNDLSEYMGNRR
jgi:serine/threonine-protein kinase